MIDQLRDAAHAARCQIRRDKEQAQRKSLEQRGDNDQNIIEDCGPVFFHLVFPRAERSGASAPRSRSADAKESLLSKSAACTCASTTPPTPLSANSTFNVDPRSSLPPSLRSHPRLPSYPARPCQSRSFAGRASHFLWCPRWEYRTPVQYPE